MKLGDTGNADALPFGKPLDGVRVLALEQMQALPYATQLLARLGADVVKVESTKGGDLGRGSLPGHARPRGPQPRAPRSCATTSARSSICVDLKAPEGRQLILDLAPKFDIVAENFKGGALARMGLGYDDIAAVHPAVVYVSVSGLRQPRPHRPTTAGRPTPPSPRPCRASTTTSARSASRPMPSPVGALGDIGTAPVRHHRPARRPAPPRPDRHRPVRRRRHVRLDGRHDRHRRELLVDGRVAQAGPGMAMILDGFEASNGWFIIQCGREHEFERLANAVGHPEWLTDERLSTRQGWRDHMDDVLRPGVKAWAADKTNVEACFALAQAGVAAGPVPHAGAGHRRPAPGRRATWSSRSPAPTAASPCSPRATPSRCRRWPTVPRPACRGSASTPTRSWPPSSGLDDAALAALREKGVVA